jgi:hypothetical protein
MTLDACLVVTKYDLPAGNSRSELIESEMKGTCTVQRSS